MDNVLTVPEAAAALPCSVRQIYRLIRKQQMAGTYYRVGRRIFFSAEKLKQWKAHGGSEQFKET